MDFSAAGKSVKGSASGKGHGFRGRYRLIVASNRDEYLDRETHPVHFWKDANQNLLAGRDKVAGGTWLGVSRSGKFATVTNIPSTWDFILATVAEKGWTKSTLLASKATAVAAAAIVAAAAAALLPSSGDGGDGGDGSSRRSAADGHSGIGGSSNSGSGWASVAAAASLRLLGSSSSNAGPSLGLACALCAAAGLATAASVGLAVVAASVKARKSRGGLVANFLKGDEDAATYCLRLSKERSQYAGFNLVLVDSSGAWLLSNRDEAGVTRLPHGLYGVSNATLDKPWAKTIYGKSCVLQILLRMAADPTLTEDTLVDLLMDVLADETPQPPQPQPSLEKFERTDPLASVCVPATTEVGMEWLRSIKLGLLGWTAPQRKYATRSSTVVLVDAAGRMKVVERNLGGDKSDGSCAKGGKDGKAIDEVAAEEAMHMRNATRNTFEFCDV
eukprot:g8581.t1